ncbi:iron(III) ABC transporter, ATP-binding protein, putative [unidentified eubacterium SCB49]|nr:iron(III) ABC transporter, ATP-binding protein, putative [unidentified eubacterium SCB49]
MASKKSHTRITVQEVSIGYTSKKKEVIVAKNINFSSSKGELIALVGPNGIGKSTLIRTITGMEKPIAGSIKVSEVDIKNLSPAQLASQISVVLTETLASRNLTVYELIALGRQPYTNWLGVLSDNDKEAVTKAITITETTDLQHKKCFELSDGELQRVLIARALAQDTAVIILDEPTSHLDLYHKAYVLKLLKRLTVEEGKTIFFSTHEIGISLGLADKMLVLQKDAISFNTPKKLAQEGVFNTLFPSNTINFDIETMQFRVNN